MDLEDAKAADDLEAPLLDPPLGPPPPADPDGQAPPPSPRAGGGCSPWGGTSNLIVSAVGAGMLSLPKAFEQTGILVGLLLFSFVCALTYFSASIVVRHAGEERTVSYGQLVKGRFGRGGAVVLQLSIIVHVFGVMVVYLVAIQDMLVGSAPYFQGVLPQLLGRHDNPIWLSRPTVVGVLVVGVICPLLIPRSLTSVARFSRLSVLMIASLAATICGLAAAAVAQGKAAHVHVLPSQLGAATASPGGAAPSAGVLVDRLGLLLAAPATALVPASLRSASLGVALELLFSSISVLSVACLACTIHFVVLPVRASLKRGDSASMASVLSQAVGLTTLIYAIFAISGYVLFGEATQGDVLVNLTVEFAATLVPRALAVVLIDGVLLAYTFNLLVNFVLKTWAARENVVEMLSKTSDRALTPIPYYTVTFALVAAAYGLAVVTPSIYSLIAVVGATACVAFSYLFPGLLVYQETDAGSWRRAAAAGMLVLGVLMAVVQTSNSLTGGI